MSYALYIPVIESLADLRSLLKKALLMLQPQPKDVDNYEKSGDKGISKRELMDSVGASSQGIHTWRTMYKQGGMEALMHNGRKGKAGNPSVFSKDEYKKKKRS